MDEDLARDVLIVLQQVNHAGASRDDLADAVEEAADMLAEYLDEDEDEEADEDEDFEDEDQEEEEEETKEIEA